MSREGVQLWTQARLVQCNITCGGSEARHLGGSAKQTEGDNAFGDSRAKSVLLCKGKAQSLHWASSTRRRGTRQSAVRPAEKELVWDP